MNEYKNPAFVLEMLPFLRRSGDTWAVFVGEGPLRDWILKEASRLGLGDVVRVVGWRADVPALMLASDLLICPSDEQPKEGLGLVVVEAQAAGLRTLCSQSFSDEAFFNAGLVEILPISYGPARWAESANTILASPIARPVVGPLDMLRASSFSIAHSAEALRELHEEGGAMGPKE